MRTPPFAPPILRLAIASDPLPDDGEPIAAPRPKGSRRPHTDLKVARVKRLIEETCLTYGEIAKKTGVGRASICRWTKDGGWQRPVFAPRATDTVPRARASAQLKRRTLSERLSALAERHVAELEAAPSVDPEKLGQALELLKMAKLAAMGRRRRRKDTGAASRFPRGEDHLIIDQSDPLGDAPARPLSGMRPILQLCAADVDLARAPRAAIDDFLESRAAPPEGEEPPQRERGWARRTAPFTREAYHRWMKEREG